jgi:beta-glucosidase
MNAEMPLSPAELTPPTESGPAAQPRVALRFPPGFRWGVATSAYQIEGAATTDGRGESIWDRFSHTPGRTNGGDTGDVSADHYHRWAADLDLMKSLGIDSYRFSIAWPRVLPTGRGQVNAKGLDFYKQLVDGLGERGIDPVVTLYHWDLPQALEDAGGWQNRDCANWFAEYAAVMYEALGAEVPIWLTINEPKTIVDLGYTYGQHAPGVADRASAMVVAHHLLLAHGLAVQAFRASTPATAGSRIGLALNLAPVYPAANGAPDSPPVTLMDARENRLYLDPVLRGSYPEDLFEAEVPADAPVRAAIHDGDLETIATPVDLLAVQYYYPIFVDESGGTVTKLATSVATWQQIYPQGFTDLLIRVHRDYGDIPILITENGVPVDDRLDGDGVHDPARITFLHDHLTALHRAIGAGVRVEGYQAWSLMDNFEWASGYAQRWGLVYVDYPTQRRVLKDSALWYRDVIARNGL